MDYHRPTTLAKALEIMDKEGVGLQPLAGCTDVSVGKQEGVLKKFKFIDLSFIESLHYIKEEEGYVYLGSLCTHDEMDQSPIIREKAEVLSTACSLVGSPQIRHRGTVGGNIGHASPSGDSIPAFLVLNAEFKLESPAGERWVPAVEFFKGPGSTVREQNELITSIRFRPLTEKHFTFFMKLGQRKSLSCSKINIAIVIEREEGVLKDVRIALGAVAPTVIRVKETEKLLEGKTLTPELMEEAVKKVQEEVHPISDLRSTLEYRKEMAGVLLEKGLKELMATL